MEHLIQGHEKPCTPGAGAAAALAAGWVASAVHWAPGQAVPPRSCAAALRLHAHRAALGCTEPHRAALGATGPHWAARSQPTPAHTPLCACEPAWGQQAGTLCWLTCGLTLLTTQCKLWEGPTADVRRVVNGNRRRCACGRRASHAVQVEPSSPAQLCIPLSATQVADLSTQRNVCLTSGCKPSVCGVPAGPTQPPCCQAAVDTTHKSMALGAAADSAAESGTSGGLARRSAAAAPPASSTSPDRSAARSKCSGSCGAARPAAAAAARTAAGCLGRARRPGHRAAAVLL